MSFTLFRISVIGYFFISLLSCNNTTVKKYEDYKESDFYEVQGVVKKVIRSPKLFDSPRSRTVFYDYHLDLGKPIAGKEENIDLVVNPGDAIVVLVCKNDIKVSFFCRHGIIDDRLKIGVHPDG